MHKYDDDDVKMLIDELKEVRSERDYAMRVVEALLDVSHLKNRMDMLEGRVYDLHRQVRTCARRRTEP